MNFRTITILTGAGISAESGLGTFRDEGGLWSRYSLKEVATPEGFAADPHKVHGFYNARRANAAEALPNAAHHAIARLQGDPRHDTMVITQNVDHLHEAAGSTALHMHGELARALCGACGHRWDAPAEMAPGDTCPACATTATRPDVVWFGEMPYHLPEIDQRLARTDLFVAIGTSGQVHPAAGFVEEARMHGAHCVEINLEPSEIAGLFHETVNGLASEAVPLWVDRLIG